MIMIRSRHFVHANSVIYFQINLKLSRSLISPYSFFFPDDLTTFWEADFGQFGRQIFAPPKSGFRGRRRRSQRQKETNFGRRRRTKGKEADFGAPEAVLPHVYHLSSSNLVFLGTYFNRPKGEKNLGGKNMFLLVKCRPKGGEIFGRQILGGKVGKVGKEADFGGRKKKL